MSREAMDAVQRHSQFQGPGPDHYYPFRVLMAIAYYADTNGVAGREGDPHKCPATRSIAERANISRTILADKVDILVESGELEIVASGGAGRGSWTVYRVVLPIDNSETGVPIHRETAHRQGEQCTNTDDPLLERMVHLLEQMNERMVHLEHEMVHLNGSNGTRSPQEAVPETYRDHSDPDQKPKGDPPNPPSGRQNDAFDFQPNPVIPASSSPADLRVKAIADVCGLDVNIPDHLRQCENAAAQLGRYDADFIRGRYGSLGQGVDVPTRWQWYVDDWRGQKGEQPTPKQVVSTVGRQRQEVPTSARASPADRKMGNNEAAARQYAKLKKQMRGER